jgi:hypothetical protein
MTRDGPTAVGRSDTREIAMSRILVPIPVGELVDKLTILEIKSERIAEPAKLVNIRRELALLNQTWQDSGLSQRDIGAQRSELKRINETLWQIEDAIRRKEAAGVFDKQFIELARSVYIQNDRRAAVKRAINTRLGSALIEEKSYPDYRPPDVN